MPHTPRDPTAFTIADSGSPYRETDDDRGVMQDVLAQVSDLPRLEDELAELEQ